MASYTRAASNSASGIIILIASFASLSALAEASQHLQFDALKYEIEQMRRYESIQGYVITELTDVHWECNGLLDMYRNPKVYHPLLKKLNADDVLIPLWERLAFSAGESVHDDSALFTLFICGNREGCAGMGQ